MKADGEDFDTIEGYIFLPARGLEWNCLTKRTKVCKKTLKKKKKRGGGGRKKKKKKKK